MEVTGDRARRRARERLAKSETRRRHRRAERDGTTVKGGPVDKLVRVGFSEYEARAYITLLKSTPMTSDALAQVSGIPCSLGRPIAEQLVEQGAAITLCTGPILRYAPVPVDELLDRLQEEYSDLITSIREDLRSYPSSLDPNPVWNIEGEANVLARAASMIRQADGRIYVGALPATLEGLRPALESAIARGILVVVYTTIHLDLPGARVIVSPQPEAKLEKTSEGGLILIRDGEEALIGEWLAPRRAQATWTRGSALVSIVEQHLVRGGRRRFLVLEHAGR
jgi:sugar-specific transcriptional regulator TrmB